MKSRFVRFAAPSFGPDSKAETATATIAPPAPGDGGAFSSDGNNGVAPTSAFAHRRPSVTVNAPSEIPSLASALAQSVRHHSRLVDGEHSSPIPMPMSKPQHKSLATSNYLDISSNKNSWESYTVQRGSVMSSARRPSLDDTVVTGSSRGARVIDSRSSFQMQHEHERGESFNLRNGRNRGFGEASENDNRYTSFGPGQTVDYNVPFVSPVPKADSLPGSSSNGSSSHNLIAPPPWAHHLFSTAMRHSSNLPIPSEHSNNIECSDASRRFFASRKNRHDSSLRFIVLVTCFGLSLMFAIFYGEGKFGLALANMAYEVKVTHMYGTANITNPNVQEKVSKGELVYPEWWDNQKGIPNMRAKGIQFSAALDNHTADVSQPRPPGRVDTPFFWFTTRSRGNVIRAIMSNCFHLVEASGFGKDSIQPFLLVQEREGRKFVNVDLSTVEGLSRAKDLKLASSGIPDVIISEDIHSILDIFDSQNRVIMFAVFRHPLDRAMSQYYADIASDPAVASMSLQQYIRSGEDRLENNHLTRYLSGRYHGDLREEHLDIAREFLRRKFVVGLARDLPTTAELFSRVFGWRNATDIRGSEDVDLCIDTIFHELAAKSQPSLEEGSEGWKMVMAQNWFDLKLYEYAEHLFQLQADHMKLKSLRKPGI